MGLEVEVIDGDHLLAAYPRNPMGFRNATGVGLEGGGLLGGLFHFKNPH